MEVWQNGELCKRPVDRSVNTSYDLFLRLNIGHCSRPWIFDWLLYLLTVSISGLLFYTKRVSTTLSQPCPLPLRTTLWF